MKKLIALVIFFVVLYLLFGDKPHTVSSTGNGTANNGLNNLSVDQPKIIIDNASKVVPQIFIKQPAPQSATVTNANPIVVGGFLKV